MFAKVTSVATHRLIEPETDRIWLRQWRPEDREPFAELCADPEVMEFLSGRRDSATAFAAIDKWSALISERGWGFWAIEVKQTSEFIGFVGLQVPAEGHPFLPCVEIGWRLARQHWGRGYATEGARESLRVAFELLELPAIIATTALGNTRSRMVMERLGMKGPETTFQHPGVPIDNPLRTHMLFRLSQKEWTGHAA
jgi:RimJ/RimL family protein N-acetyltransferase